MAPRAPTRWLVIEVPKPTDEQTADLLIDLLSTLSGRGVEERGATLIAYFDPGTDEPDRIVGALRERLSAASGSNPVELRHRWQAHEDWVDIWRRGISPRRIGERFVVSPTWETPEVRPGDLVIFLDPGIAFGTAEHATTRGCLRLLDRFVVEGQRIADVGAGSGILSVVAVLLGAEHVVAIDQDPWACSTARENAELNEVGERIQVVEASVAPGDLSGGDRFDGIVANIEPGVLIPMLESFRGALRPNGWLILGGVPAPDSGELLRAAVGSGFHFVIEDEEEGWWAGAFGA